MTPHLIKVLLVVVAGLHSPPPDYSVQVFKDALRRVRHETAARPVIRKVLYMRDVAPGYAELDKAAARATFWKNLLSRNGGSFRSGITFFLLPPAHEASDLNVYYLTGAALAGCHPRGGYAYSTPMVTSRQGFDRYPHSVVATMHELLHLLGARHVLSPISVMHPDALSYVGNASLPILRRTQRQVKFCLEKVR